MSTVEKQSVAKPKAAAKTTNTTTTETKSKKEVVAVVKDVAVVPAKEVVTATKQKKDKTTPVVVTAAPVVVATNDVIVDNNDAVVLENDESEKTLGDQFNVFMTQLHLVSVQIVSLKNEFRNLEKRCTKEIKLAQKGSKVKRKGLGTREPSGFVKPALISSELATFLNKPEGTLMARTAVTKEINNYIKEHSLQDKVNGRTIVPNDALIKLLKVGPGEQLSYFNLQKYMSHHFAKRVVA